MQLCLWTEAPDWRSVSDRRVFVLARSGLCWFGPAGLRSVLPAVDITEWRTAVSDAPRLSSQSQSVEGAAEESRQVQPYKEPLYSQPPPAEALTGEEVLDQLFYLYSLLGDSTEQQVLCPFFLTAFTVFQPF